MIKHRPKEWSSLGVFYIGQEDGARLTKILPGRQTHFLEFFWAPFGENTCPKKRIQNKIYHFVKETIADLSGGCRDLKQGEIYFL